MVSPVARSTARKSGAWESTPTMPPEEVLVTMKAPPASAATMVPTRAHCLATAERNGISGLHGAGAPGCTDRGGGVGVTEARLPRDEGISAGTPGRCDGGRVDPAVDLEGGSGPTPIEEGAGPPDLLGARRDVLLPAEPR